MPIFVKPSMTTCVLALSSALTFSAMPAKAAENSFSFPPQAATLQAGATGGVAINLPPVGSPTFFIVFVLPRDYAKNEKVSVIWDTVLDDVLGLAHPAASRATAARAAPACRAFLTCNLLVPERLMQAAPPRRAPAAARGPLAPLFPPGASRARRPHTPASG